MRMKTKNSMLERRNLGENKNTADNNRSDLLYNPQRLWKENVKAGNWPWGRPALSAPSGTKAYFKKPTPELAGVVDWSHESNQWMRGPEFRDSYVRAWQNAWSTERAFATRNQLVPGFWQETITKGRVLTQENRSDGRYNANGVNLYRYQG
jgi:hypothetical protein